VCGFLAPFVIFEKIHVKMMTNVQFWAPAFASRLAYRGVRLLYVHELRWVKFVSEKLVRVCVHIH
jgi:hypothetical protein